MRAPNACFVNNFFTEGLQEWKANIGIQPVFDHYKAVTCMCVYFSKAEDETSEAMKQAAREALAGNKSDYEGNCSSLCHKERMFCSRGSISCNA